MEQFAEGYVDELSSECRRWKDLAQSLADALEGVLDYEGQLEEYAPAAEFGAEKYNKARAALANYRKGE